jgi:hypothetical protein
MKDEALDLALEACPFCGGEADIEAAHGIKRNT